MAPIIDIHIHMFGNGWLGMQKNTAVRSMIRRSYPMTEIIYSNTARPPVH